MYMNTYSWFLRWQVVRTLNVKACFMPKHCRAERERQWSKKNNRAKIYN